MEIDWDNTQQVLERMCDNPISYSEDPKRISKRIRNDPIIMEQILKYKGYCLKYAGSNIKNDKIMVTSAIQERNSYYFKYASDSLRKDKEFVIDLINDGNDILKYVDKSLQNDKDVALLSFIKFKDSIKFISKELLDDCNFVFELFKIDVRAIRHISDRLKSDLSVIKYCIDPANNNRKTILGCHGYFRYAKEYFNDHAVVSELIHINPNIIQYCSKSIKMDKDLMLQVVQLNGFMLKYVGKAMRNDLEIVYTAYQSNSDSLKYIGTKLLKKINCDRVGQLYKRKFEEYILKEKSNRIKSARF